MKSCKYTIEVYYMNYINTLNSYDYLQKTLRRKIHFSGVGVHNGRAVSMSLEPAEADTGIIFYRTDVDNNNVIKGIINSCVVLNNISSKLPS